MKGFMSVFGAAVKTILIILLAIAALGVAINIVVDRLSMAVDEYGDERVIVIQDSPLFNSQGRRNDGVYETR